MSCGVRRVRPPANDLSSRASAPELSYRVDEAFRSPFAVVSGFISPESVIHDLRSDLYLISNVGGSPLTANHGFISRVSPDGGVADLRWIQDGVNGVTLHGPEGLWLYHNELYVADVDTLRIFNRHTGGPIRNVPIPNPFAPSALFLNHVIVADSGTVAASFSDLIAVNVRRSPTVVCACI